MQELRLESRRGQPQPRTVAVRVEALGMEGQQPLETRPMAPPGGSSPMRFAWSHTLKLAQGDSAWNSLLAAVEAAQSATSARGGKQGSKMNFYFVVFDASEGSDMGEAAYDLESLLAPGARDTVGMQSLRVNDRQGNAVGTLSIRVKAAEAIKIVQQPPPPADDGRDSGRGGRDSSRDSGRDAGPSKRVEQLSVSDLHALLSARGVRLSSTLQKRTFYLDQCRKQKIETVTESELQQARSGDPPPPEAKLDLAVEEVTLTDRTLQYSNARSVCVRVEALGIEGPTPLETQALSPPSGSRPFRFSWAHTLTLTQGSEGWNALARAIDQALAGGRDAPRFEILFAVIDAGHGGVLGQAGFDLSPLLRNSTERATQQLQLFDQRHPVGNASVTVRALDAIRLVRDSPAAPERGPNDPPRMQKVTVTVPQYHMPNEPIPVEFEGQTYEVQVPRGMRAGQSFEVELAIASSGGRGGGRNEPPSPAGSNRSRGRWGEPAAGGDRGRRDDSRDSYRDGDRDGAQSPGGSATRTRGRWGGDAGAAQQPQTGVDRRRAYDDQRKSTQQQQQQRYDGRGGQQLSATVGGQPGELRGRSPGRSPGRNSRDDLHHDQRYPSSSQHQSSHPGSLASTMPASMPATTYSGAPAFPSGTSPTEVEHALIVAFERLGQANSQIATHGQQRGKLEKELVKEREKSESLQRELRQVKAEREAQGQRLAELGAAGCSRAAPVSSASAEGGGVMGGVGAGMPVGSARSVAERGYTEQLRKRLGKMQKAHEEEARVHGGDPTLAPCLVDRVVRLLCPASAPLLRLCVR